MKQLRSALTMRRILSFVIVVAANIILAASTKFFLIPANLATGGATGIGLALQHAADLDISLIILILNVIMLISGAVCLGIRYAATTVVSSFAYPIALGILDRLFPGVVLTEDVLLCTLFAGLGMGVSVGIAFRVGASTGGLDILVLILHKYLRVNTAALMYATDVLVLLLQVPFTSVDTILYSIVLVAVYSIIIDKMMLIGTTQTEVKIVSGKADEIREAILSGVNRGVTMIHARGGYRLNDTEMILSVLSNREVPKLKRIVFDIDPECFMTVSRINEVSGRGFSLEKVMGKQAEHTRPG